MTRRSDQTPMRTTLAAALVLLWGADVPARTSAPSLGAGTSVTAGSRGYSRYSAFGDANWTGTAFDQELDPYAWTQFDVDNYLWELGLGGGAWKNLTEDFRVKGGLGVEFGRIQGSGDSADSFVLETGAEKQLRENRVGAEYRLTAGSVGGPTLPSVNDQNLRARAQGRASGRSTTSAASYTYNEFSGYGWTPAGKTRLGLRATAGLPSYSRPILSETATWRIPLRDPWSLSTAVTFEQATSDNVYFTAGVNYLFRSTE